MMLRLAAAEYEWHLQALTQKNWPSLKIGVAEMLQKCMLLIIH